MPVVPVYRGLGIQKISTILQQNMKRHRILEQITSFALTEPIIDNQKLRGAYYVVITLNSKKREAYVRGYKENQYHQAFENYAQCEQDSRHNQSVLIAVNKLRSLHDAYPNYFADLNLFLKIIDYILAKSRKIR